ncbi:MAG: sialate O-acetylesterase, partial [Bacteroidetes bacterium]|nr:sialate O-acetylesterase [Bacteroidota bacterium]
MKKLILSVMVLCLMFQIQAEAKVIMPVLFGDGMVLQRDMPLRIFGEASEGASITVRLNGQEQSVRAWEGKWMLTLEPMPAGGPYEMYISGDGEEIVYRDVMLGEVWLAGGQSNMALALQSHIDFEKHLPAEENPELRFIHIPVTEHGEIDRTGLEWKYFDRESVKTFSAVAYFFATELQKHLGVTVAVIGSYRGGTWNENWMTPESVKMEAELKYLFDNYKKEYAEFKDEAAYEEAYQQYLADLDDWKDKGGWSYGMVPFAPLGPKAYQRPSGLYNSMIKPLQPYSIKGCIWYQGEGNSARHEEFRTLFPAFVEGWRDSWQQADLPFYFVQLPGYGKGKTWPEFRQAQLDCAQKTEH